MIMPLAYYYDVGRELHELKHNGEFLATRNGIMVKFGASILLSYSGLVVSYVTRNELGFFRVIPSSNRDTINMITTSSVFETCHYVTKAPFSLAIALSSY